MSAMTVVSLTSHETGQFDKKKALAHTDEEFVSAVVQSEKSPSIGELLRTFAVETSMHGVKNATQGNRRLLHRILWGGMVLAMAAWLAFTAADLYLKYLSYPYTTSIDVSRRAELPFPAITFCLEGFNVDRNDLEKMDNSQMLSEYLLTLTEMTHYLPVNWTSDDLTNNFGNASFEDIFHNFSMDIGDIFTFGLLGYKIFFPKVEFTVQQVDGNKCFSYNFKGMTTNPSNRQTGEKTVRASEYLQIFLRLDKSRILPSLKSGLAVYIHKPDEPVSGYDTPINVPVNSAATILLDPTEYTFLPEPYLSFSGLQCVDTAAPGYQSSLSFNLSYSWSNCITKASIKHATNVCRCASGWSKDFFPDLPQCNLAQNRDCYNYHKQNEGRELLYGSKSGYCLPPCTFREFKHKASITTPFPTNTFKDYVTHTLPNSSLGDVFDGYISLQVGYESSLVTVMEHKPAMSLEDIYGTLGGQMGFFLGASLLTMTELFEAVVCLVWTILFTKTKGLTSRLKAKVGSTTRVTAFAN